MIEIKLEIDTEKKQVLITHDESSKDICHYYTINEIATYLSNYMYENLEEINYDYLFKLSNDDKFYIDEEGETIYIKSYNEELEEQANEEISLRLIPMERIILLRLEKTDVEITDCTLDGHYHLRSLIEELKEDGKLSEWQNGIDKYKKYCIENKITNEELNDKYTFPIPNVFNEEQQIER